MHAELDGRARRRAAHRRVRPRPSLQRQPVPSCRCCTCSTVRPTAPGARRRFARRSCSTTPTCTGAPTGTSGTRSSRATPAPTATTRSWRRSRWTRWLVTADGAALPRLARRAVPRDPRGRAPQAGAAARSRRRQRESAPRRRVGAHEGVRGRNRRAGRPRPGPAARRLLRVRHACGGELGFDALCYNDGAADAPRWDLAGTQLADVVAGGLPALPRRRLGDGREELALEAYLRRPLILYGHHWDLAGGLDVLEREAAHVPRSATSRGARSRPSPRATPSPASRASSSACARTRAGSGSPCRPVCAHSPSSRCPARPSCMPTAW